MKNKKRQYNIEVLRIISMFLVLLIHYNFSINGQPDNEMLSLDFYKSIGILELQSLDVVCVNCFILISGYFGIHWKWYSFFNFIFQIFFWVIFSYIFACFIHYEAVSYSLFLHKIATFLSYNWFILSYLGLYLFAPVLNKFIENSSKSELVLFTFAFYLFQTVFGYLTKSVPEFNDGMSFISLIGLYFLGACIRILDTKYFKLNKYLDLTIYLGLGFLLTIISLIAIRLGFTKSVYGYMNPIVLMESLSLYLFFTKININAPWVMFFSSSAFAVYLFHYNPSIYPFYLDLCRFFSDNLGFGGILLFLSVLFVSVVFLDKTRNFIFQKCWNLIV